jgi:hypothetical protein
MRLKIAEKLFEKFSLHPMNHLPCLPILRDALSFVNELTLGDCTGWIEELNAEIQDANIEDAKAFVNRMRRVNFIDFIDDVSWHEQLLSTFAFDAWRPLMRNVCEKIIYSSFFLSSRLR